MWTTERIFQCKIFQTIKLRRKMSDRISNHNFYLNGPKLSSDEFSLENKKSRIKNLMVPRSCSVKITRLGFVYEQYSAYQLGAQFSLADQSPSIYIDSDIRDVGIFQCNTEFTESIIES